MGTLVGSAQITIIDVNDTLFTGSTAPLNPVANVTVWCDTSTSPNLMKKWNGTTWDVTGSQIFTTQPTTAQSYSIGDLWSNATVGSYTNELLKCTTAKLSGASFNVSHWTLATKYTDDSAVNNLQISSRNLIPNSLLNTTLTTNAPISRSFSALTIGKTYTFRAFLSSCTNNSSVNVYLRNGDWSHYYHAGKTISGSGYIDLTFIAEYNDITLVDSAIGSDSSSGKYEWFTLVEGNKPMISWVAAPEDIQSQIDTSNALLADIASDSILTPNEKSQVAKEWGNINSVYYGLLDQADSLGVSYVDYQYFYSELYDYITPLLASMTTKISINGSSFRAYFATYYTYESDLRNRISQEGYNFAAAVNNNLSNLQIGGRNLLTGTNKYDSWTKSGVTTVNEEVIIPCNGGTNYILPIQSNSIFTIGKTYTISCKVRNDWSGNIPFYISSNGNSSTTTSTSSVYVVKVLTFVAANNNAVMLFESLGNNYAGKNIYVKDIKVELGGKATDYTPAPEDTDAKIMALDYLKAAMQSTTDVDGGLLSTVLLRMKDLAGVINGGMSGLTDNIGFWTGGTYAQALANLAKIILKKDGSGQLAGGKIFWDVIGALSIGNFKIEGGAIIARNNSNKEVVKLHNSDIQTVTDIANASWVYANDKFSFPAFTIDNSSEYNMVQKEETVIFAIPVAGNFVVAAPTAILNGETSLELNGTMLINEDEGELRTETDCRYYLINENGTLGVATWIGFDEDVYVAAGTYGVTVRSIFYDDRYVKDSELTIATEAEGNVQFQDTVTKTEIGSNGFFSFWSSLKFLHYSKEFGLKLRGSIDIPAGLGGGSVGSGGAYSQGWGLSYSSSKSTYTITILHNITDTKFTVNVTPRNSFTWYLSSVTAATSSTSNNGTIVIVTSISTSILDFVIVRTPY